MELGKIKVVPQVILMYIVAYQLLGILKILQILNGQMEVLVRRAEIGVLLHIILVMEVLQV